ncbi:MAG: dTDP-4-dehydrorhamnose 3,5-epimerase [Spirochaetae bacterium HGW-Spirochaetae-3]|jgi:dTDP-4-dehydrorhamnose 3,5-epimerase|nr:MAG: dTDP-4-dehydrorhamnose 3,5-epimerase [Spirochaetae bacterium HGW-Spirochaetae-3]
MPFIFEKTFIDGLLIITPRLFTDERGFFLESYKSSEFAAAGIREAFVQDNHSRSIRGVLRGLHFQKAPYAQAKLVRVTRGLVWDVAVDLRHGSPTFGRWLGVELGEENRKMLFLPRGFAHGFVALSEGAELIYKCSAEYDKDSDGGVRWDDPDLGIEWPLSAVKLSEKDAALPFLRDIAGELS